MRMALNVTAVLHHQTGQKSMTSQVSHELSLNIESSSRRLGHKPANLDLCTIFSPWFHFVRKLDNQDSPKSTMTFH